MAVYCDSFGIKYIPQEVLNKIQDKIIIHNIFQIQARGFIMCRFYCIAFIEYMLLGIMLLDYTNLFSPNDYQTNDKIIYKCFTTNMTEETGLNFRQNEVGETRNFLLAEIKHNILIS